MIHFSDSALRRTAEHFDEKTLRRGIQYAMEGRVHLVKHEWPIVAKVRGTHGYVVTINYNPVNEHLSSECSCPVLYECKHAAASVLVHFEACENEIDGHQESYQAQAVGRWLVQLGQHTSVKPRAEPSKNTVVYILDKSGELFDISFHRTSVLKRGGYARSSRIASIAEPSRNIPAWLQPDDLRLISTIRALTRATAYESVHSVRDLDEVVFRDMCSTGRLFWENVQSIPLSWGQERRERLAWSESEEDPEEFRLGVTGGVLLVPSRSCLYIDLQARAIGPLELGIPAGIVETIVSGPVIPRSMLPTAEKSLRGLLLPSVRDAIFPQRADDGNISVLQPFLRASIAQGVDRRIELILEARYGDQSFPLGVWNAPNQDSKVTRDLAQEGHLRARFEEVNARHSAPDSHGQKHLLESAQHLAHHVLPVLLTEGWACELAENFPAELPIVDPEWAEELKPVSGGYDWFSLGLGVVVDGRVVQLLPILLEAIGDGRINFEEGAFARHQPIGINLTLPSGELVHVPKERLARWIRPLIELKLRGLNSADDLLIPNVSAANLLIDDGEPSPFANTKHHAELRSTLSGLLDLKPKKPGKGFEGQLRNYQCQGLAWLHFLHTSGFGGLLCDDMGLGKTVQLLAFFDGLRASRNLPRCAPILVVAPRSVLGNWLSETKRFTPKLSAFVHLGSGRKKNSESLRSTRIVITSYQTLLRDIELFRDVQWTSIIFDEAQALKNPSTKLRRSVAKLSAHSRFCVTGTPIENHLGELWSQVDLVMPGLLGSRATFGLVFRNPIEKRGDDRALHLLRQRIRPFLLRRTKSEVDIDLPEKTEVLERIPFDTGQRDLYESLRIVLDKKVRNALKARGVHASSLVVLDALLRLRQCCCDPRLLKMAQPKTPIKSAKLERLMSILEQLSDSGRFVLVFSQFTTMLNLIEAECKKSDIGYVKLTGQTRNREAAIQAFQDGNVPVFLISLKAGGVGLNLTRADTVIHYDPWWNPAAENQATDRAHRIGQTKNLMVYKLVAEKTLEERICVMQKEKQQLTDAALSEGGITHFGAEDLQALFQSL